MECFYEWKLHAYNVCNKFKTKQTNKQKHLVDQMSSITTLWKTQRQKGTNTSTVKTKRVLHVASQPFTPRKVVVIVIEEFNMHFDFHLDMR